MLNSSENNYLSFTEQDFINDPFFQDWIVHSTKEIEEWWASFLKSHPEKAPAIDGARRFLQAVNFEDEVLNEDYIHQHYLQHLAQVQTKKRANIFGLNIKTIRRVALIAALVAGVVLAVAIVFSNKRAAVEKVVVATNFGEIKKVSLPDGSSIILNGHSNVTFSKNWDKEQAREIWLKGEAFFDVRHLNNGKRNIKPFERFLVHGEGFMIEVLGTSFDIRQRRGKTEVVLQTGKIKLTLNDSDSPILMLPGDLVSYTPTSKTIAKNKTVPENYSGWKEKKLLLTDPTLTQITNYLEDNYGKKIVIESEKIRNKKIDGPIDLNNLDDALFIISTVYNAEIERKKDLILIRSK